VTAADVIRAIASLPADQLPALMIAIAARMADGNKPSVVAGDDKLLDVAEAAALLGVSKSWLHHRPNLPFRRKLGGKLKFSKAGILRWQQRDHNC
jgi:predicted DNA-binding transcriptional regulator AlpA